MLTSSCWKINPMGRLNITKQRLSKIFVFSISAASAYAMSTIRGGGSISGNKDSEEVDPNQQIVWESPDEFVASKKTMEYYFDMPLRFRKDGDATSTTVDTSNFPPKSPFPEMAYYRMDESNDALFYRHPRVNIHHIDDECIIRLQDWYSDFIQKQFKDLPNKFHIDLASSWVSHVPKDCSPSERYIGIGMNMEELKANPKLNEQYVVDLNKQPDALQSQLNLADDSVDFIHMDLSIDYMKSPIPLLASVYKALKPNQGAFVASFSNRMFHTKAVRMWLLGECQHRQKIVAAYLHFAGFDRIGVHQVPPVDGRGIDPLNVIVGFKEKPTNEDGKSEL